MIIEGIVISVGVAYLRKGKLRNFERIDIKGWYLPIISQLMQGAAIRLSVNPTSSIARFAYTNFEYIHIASYLLLVITFILNYKQLSMKLLAIGTFLNFIPIAFNNGQMPVLLPKGIEASLEISHVIANDTTKFLYLSDFIPLLRPYPLPKIISVGDIFLMLGIFLFIQYGMVCKQKAV